MKPPAEQDSAATPKKKQNLLAGQAGDGGGDAEAGMQFLVRLNNISQEVAAHLKPVLGKKGTVAQFSGHVSKYWTHAQCPKDAASLDKELNACVERLRKVCVQCETCKEDEIDTLEREYTKARETLTTLLPKIAKAQQTLGLIAQKVLSSNRKSYLHHRHQKEKIVQALTDAGFGKEHAKKVSDIIYTKNEDNGQEAEEKADASSKKESEEKGAAPKKEADEKSAGSAKKETAGKIACNPDKQSFDHKCVSWWGAETPFVKDLIASYAGQWVNAAENIDAEMESKTKWAGCLSSFPGEVDRTKIDLPFETSVADLATDLSTIVTGKMNKRRHDPKDVPVPGMGALWIGRQGSAKIIMYNLSAILSHGVALQDLDSFLETPSGKEMVDSAHIVVASLSEGEALFTPWGWLPAVVYMVPAAGPKADKFQGPQWAHLLHIPCIGEEMWKQVDPATFAVIGKQLLECTEAKPKVKLYKDFNEKWLACK